MDVSNGAGKAMTSVSWAPNNHTSEQKTANDISENKGDGVFFGDKDRSVSPVEGPVQPSSVQSPVDSEKQGDSLEFKLLETFGHPKALFGQKVFHIMSSSACNVDVPRIISILRESIKAINCQVSSESSDSSVVLHDLPLKVLNGQVLKISDMSLFLTELALVDEHLKALEHHSLPEQTYCLSRLKKSMAEDSEPLMILLSLCRHVRQVMTYVHCDQQRIASLAQWIKSQAFEGCFEIMAGSGAVSHSLRSNGIAIESSDNFEDASSFNEFTRRFISSDVVQKPAQVVVAEWSIHKPESKRLMLVCGPNTTYEELFDLICLFKVWLTSGKTTSNQHILLYTWRDKNYEIIFSMLKDELPMLSEGSLPPGLNFPKAEPFMPNLGPEMIHLYLPEDESKNDKRDE